MTDNFEEEEIREYTEDIQFVLLQFLISDNELFTRCRNIIEPQYFEPKFRSAVRFVLKYADEYSALPTVEQIRSQTGLSIDKISATEIERKHGDWFLKEIETFCRHRALENVIESSPSMIEKGYYNLVESQIKDAVLISLQKDLGINYFHDLEGIVRRLQDKHAITSTGWKTVDKKLFGGFNRGELNIFAGVSGAGKSLFLQNLALNWIEMGLNVIYITLELSEELVGLRFHAMLSGTTTKDVHRNIDDTCTAIQQKKRKSETKWGSLHIKYMSPGTQTNDIKAYLKEFEIQTNLVLDCLIIDYLDLLHPNNKKVDAGNLFIKDKFVSEELRSLAQENNLLFCTASQLNRSAMEEQEHEMYHIAGGVSKINTADNVITIYISESLKQRGEYRLQFIKTRSSSGVGSKVFLNFSIDTLRITDQDEAEHTAKNSVPPPSQMIEQLKRRSKQEKENGGSKPNDIDEHAASIRDLIKRARG